MSHAPPVQQAASNDAIADAGGRLKQSIGNGHQRPAAVRGPVAGSNGYAGDDPINLLIRGLNYFGLDWRAHETNPDGPWRAQCPLCHAHDPEDDPQLTLTLTRRGDVRCRRLCDPGAIAETLLSAGREVGLKARVEDVTGGARIVTLEEFAAAEEDGAAPVIGEPDRILIPEGGDVMFYGDGGAGKTTLTLDLACHLGAGVDWLEITVPQPRRVLLVESEGPRPLFRKKLARKLEAWRGPALAGRVLVFEQPWAQITFAAEEWRVKLAHLVKEREVDVLIAGPLSRLGMDVAGTLQEVRAFMDLVADVRRQSERPLTVALVHHENKGGAVSGAWEGAGDTLLHVQAAGNGHTVVYIQKARWDSERHGKTLHLAWADGDGFRLEGDRDYFAELEELLADGKWRTIKEMSAPDEEGGIGAGEKAIRATLDTHPERFASRTGDEAKAIGRHPSATVWQVRYGSNAPDAPRAFSGGAEDGAALRPALKGAAPDEPTPVDLVEGASSGPTQLSQPDLDAELEQLTTKFPDLAGDGR